MGALCEQQYERREHHRKHFITKTVMAIIIIKVSSPPTKDSFQLIRDSSQPIKDLSPAIMAIIITTTDTTDIMDTMGITAIMEEDIMALNDTLNYLKTDHHSFLYILMITCSRRPPCSNSIKTFLLSSLI